MPFLLAPSCCFKLRGFSLDLAKGNFRIGRNETLVNVMRDYRYLDSRGMGIPYKIIPGMQAHNGTEPDFVAEEHRFTVRLWLERKDAR